jgi:hypothetical protein
MLETDPSATAAANQEVPYVQHNPLGTWNRRIGWLTASLGAASGLIMGFWSFDGPLPVPEWLGEYDQTARRLARLGHIAFFGLGILNILVAGELRRLAAVSRSGRVASWAMSFGNVFLPLTLFVAAAYRPAKYFMSVPALAVFVALVVTAYGVCGGWPNHDTTA